MTVSTLRPNATVSSAGLTVAGAASAHAALADDSDSSYITGDAPLPIDATCHFGLPEVTLPAGAVVKDIGIRARARRTSAGTSSLSWSIRDGDVTVLASGSSAISGTGATTVSLGAPVPLLTNPTDLRVRLTLGATGGGAEVLRIHELYVDFTYVEKPEVTILTPSGTIGDTNRPVASWEMS